MEKRIDVTIRDFKKAFEGTKDVVFYNIELKCGAKSWLIEKRFSEIERLNTELAANHPTMPPFPRKTLFSVSKPEDLENRRVQLESFLREILKRPDILNDKSAVAFLKLNEQAGVKADDELILFAEIENPALGYRDFIYVPSKKLFANLACDMNAVSRIDSYFTNFKFPWEGENKDIVFSIGLFEVCGVKTERDMKMAQMFSVSYNTQAICMEYSEALDLFAVGCDDGTLKVYKVDKTKKQMYDIVFDEKVHSKRIMKICIDSIKSTFFTISEDFSVQSIDLIRKRIEGSKLISFAIECETFKCLFDPISQKTDRR